MATVVRSLVLIVGVGSVLTGALVSPLPASAGIWNPFEESGNFFESVRNTLQTLLRSIETIAGRVVSTFLLPDPSRIGFHPRDFYRPPRFNAQTGFAPPPVGRRTGVTVPTPAPSDTPGRDDAYWASDCSCRRGAVCPDNPELSCEACRKITIGDKDTTQADCETHRHAINTQGGQPTSEAHF